jgi:hypothetical protein
VRLHCLQHSRGCRALKGCCGGSEGDRSDYRMEECDMTVAEGSDDRYTMHTAAIEVYTPGAAVLRDPGRCRGMCRRILGRRCRGGYRRLWIGGRGRRLKRDRGVECGERRRQCWSRDSCWWRLKRRGEWRRVVGRLILSVRLSA